MPHLDARAEPKAFRVVKTLSWGSMSVYTSPEQEMVRKDRSHSNQKSTVPPDEASVLTDCRVFRNASLPLLPFTSVARQPMWYSFGKLDKAELVYFRLAKQKIKMKQRPKIINPTMSASTLQ